MFSILVLLSFLVLFTAADHALPATSKEGPPAATQKVPGVKENPSAAAKIDLPANSTADRQEETKKKAEAEKKNRDLELHPIEASVISLTNVQREKYGLKPLKVDKSLMQTARKHCGWMTRNRIFQHGRWGVAENIAMGQHNSQEVLRAWMNSSGHRANILNPWHNRIGVSAYRAKDGTIYWCQQFRN
jgi:uncharacterized protein YkwD